MFLTIYNKQLWLAWMWYIMVTLRGGKGYHYPKQGRTGIGQDRRPDKLDGTPKMFRSYKSRYTKGISKRALHALHQAQEKQTESERVVA